MKNSSPLPYILSIIVICALMGVSIWFGSACASSEDFHHRDIAYLNEKQNNAKALSASASAASVLVSLLPEDTATPLANQIADIGRDFLIVLSALAAEQSLLTITGRITFCWIIPISLSILVLFVLLRRKLFLQIGVKLAIAGCVIYMMVPVTLRITRLVDKPYKEAVDNSLQTSQEIEDAFNYNEEGVVMPGMSGPGSIFQTEALTESEERTETQTEAQTEIRTDIQTEALASVTEKAPEKAGNKKKKKEKLPWYEQLWKDITGEASTAADSASKIPDRVVETVRETAQKVSDKAAEVVGKASRTVDEASKVVDKASEVLDKVVKAGERAGELYAMAPQVPQMASDLLNNLIDAFVLMIVTTCVLPIVVVIGLFWVMTQLLNIDYDWKKLQL